MLDSHHLSIFKMNRFNLIMILVKLKHRKCLHLKNYWKPQENYAFQKFGTARDKGTLGRECIYNTFSPINQSLACYMYS